MSVLEAAPKTALKTARKTVEVWREPGIDLPDFFYTEECGLSLFKHRRTGEVYYLDAACWHDLAHCLRGMRGH